MPAAIGVVACVVVGAGAGVGAGVGVGAGACVISIGVSLHSSYTFFLHMHEPSLLACEGTLVCSSQPSAVLNSYAMHESDAAHALTQSNLDPPSRSS